MASGFIGNEVPRKGLRVRVPCPPPQGFVTNPENLRRKSYLNLTYGVFLCIPR